MDVGPDSVDQTRRGNESGSPLEASTMMFSMVVVFPSELKKTVQTNSGVGTCEIKFYEFRTIFV